MVFERTKGNFTVSTDVARLDVDMIHRFLTEQSYWARGIPKGLVVRAIANSVCFGLYDGDKQIGYTRAITDTVRFANVLDVFVLEEYRGRGLGSFMMECVMEYLKPFGLRKITLATRDAQDFYRQFGFTETARPANNMEIYFELPWFKSE